MIQNTPGDHHLCKHQAKKDNILKPFDVGNILKDADETLEKARKRKKSIKKPTNFFFVDSFD